MNFSVGARVRVRLDDKREFTGVVLPGDELVLKLDDGYNIGISMDHIEDSEVLKEQSKESSHLVKVEQDSSLARVQILHTGGTIASKVDYETGGVSNLFEPEELLGMYPELQELACVDASFVANMSSDDMRFSHYNKLIDAVVEESASSPAGVIITHGTDTLHYTAAALHYALQGVSFPVVLVGSQRSSDRGSSDAFSNLQAAVRYCVSEHAQPGVFVAMHASSSDPEVSILPGVHARKLHTSRRDAFKAVNSSPVARVSEKEVVSLREWPCADEFEVTRFDESLRIGMLYAHPHMHAVELSSYDGFDGLIVLGTGLGHLPISVTDESASEHEKIFSTLEELVEQLPVVMSSQCVHGRVNLQVYSPARRLQDLGVLGHDLALTAEALFAKLAFLLSAGKDASLIGEDFGDLVVRTEVSLDE